jgi:hypothetical protein
MKITYIEIEANAEELKTTNTVSDNFLGVLNRCMEKARYGTTEPIEEEDAEEQDG